MRDKRKERQVGQRDRRVEKKIGERREMARQTDVKTDRDTKALT